jgi:hypothetical protein
MPAGKAIDSVSPLLLFRRVVAGLMLVGAVLLWPADPNFEQFRPYIFSAGVVLLIWGLNSVRNPMLALRYTSNAGTTVAELIEEWKPASAHLESEYEKSLHRFLKSRLPSVKVTRQYGSSRAKCDLATGNEVIIELKAGLKNTNKVQRLLGQIELYRGEWDRPIIVVLLGETEEDLLHDLRRNLQKYHSVHVIHKGVDSAVEPDAEKARAATV